MDCCYLVVVVVVVASLGDEAVETMKREGNVVEQNNAMNGVHGSFPLRGNNKHFRVRCGRVYVHICCSHT